MPSKGLYLTRFIFYNNYQKISYCTYWLLISLFMAFLEDENIITAISKLKKYIFTIYIVANLYYIEIYLVFNM